MTQTDIAACLEAAARQNAEGCVKTQEDLDRYGEVIDATRPARIIEVGTFSGRSAVWLARRMRAANGTAEDELRPTVLTIDVDQRNITAETRAEATRLGVMFAHGMSTGLEVMATARGWAYLEQTMVILDGDHSEATVHSELTLYAPFVGVGCYCVVEDTLVRHMPGQMQPEGPYFGNPADAVDAWLPRHPGWTVDMDLELRHGQTQFPGGWLRRDR